MSESCLRYLEKQYKEPNFQPRADCLDFVLIAQSAVYMAMIAYEAYEEKYHDSIIENQYKISPQLPIMQHLKWIVEDTNDMLRDVTYESFIYKTTAEEVEKVLTAFAEHMSIGYFSCFREVKVPSWADFGIAILESGCAL